MRVKDMTDDKYADLKNRIYKAYLLDKKYSDETQISILSQTLVDSELEILNDTIEFPFDKELSEFLSRNKNMRVHDFVLTASNLFEVSPELVASKIREYLSYDYSKLLRNNMISQNTVNELSELYLLKKQGKNQK